MPLEGSYEIHGGSMLAIEVNKGYFVQKEENCEKKKPVGSAQGGCIQFYQKLHPPFPKSTLQAIKSPYVISTEHYKVSSN